MCVCVCVYRAYPSLPACLTAAHTAKKTLEPRFIDTWTWMVCG